MAVKAIGQITSFVFIEDTATVTFNIMGGADYTAIGEGTYGPVPFTDSAASINDGCIAALKANLESVRGVVFDVGDTIRLINPVV